MASLAFTLNFDDLGVLQSVTIKADGLPASAILTMTLSGTAVGSTPVVLARTAADTTGHLLVTIIAPAKLGNVFFLGGASENIPKILAGHSLTAVANVGDPTSEVIGTLSVS